MADGRIDEYFGDRGRVLPSTAPEVIIGSGYHAAVYAAIVEPMSPRFTSSRTSDPASCAWLNTDMERTQAARFTQIALELAK